MMLVCDSVVGNAVDTVVSFGLVGECMVVVTCLDTVSTLAVVGESVFDATVVGAGVSLALVGGGLVAKSDLGVVGSADSVTNTAVE